MKNNVKKITMTLIILLLTILMGFSVVFAVYENTSSIGNTANDAKKSPASLNENYALPYKARDIATYNNLYCVNHSVALDNYVFNYICQFRASAMAEIVGNNAKFYDVISNNDGEKETKYVGETNATENNVMAGVVAAKNPGTAGKHTIYRGYGGMTFTTRR